MDIMREMTKCINIGNTEVKEAPLPIQAIHEFITSTRQVETQFPTIRIT